MELEDLIKQHVIPLIENKNGWYATRCLVCDDHMPGSPNFKGLRGNFKLFGNSIGHNCYNCDHKAIYEEGSPTYSKNMIKVFQSYGIPEIEYNKILLSIDPSTELPKSQTLQLNIEPTEIKLPDHFYLLSEANVSDKWKIIADDYLKNRSIDPNTYPFFLSTGKGQLGKKWLGRIIYPIYKDAKLVFYQGRSLLPSVIKKYESPSTEKSNVIYNYEQLITYSKKPLFIVEGFFDAYHIDGVALIGKNITKQQAMILNRCSRDKVIIPDKEGDGDRIALQAIELGWSVTFPEFGKCKDVNDAIVKYGKIYVINQIMTNISSGNDAILRLKLYCT